MQRSKIELKVPSELAPDDGCAGITVTYMESVSCKEAAPPPDDGGVGGGVAEGSTVVQGQSSAVGGDGEEFISLSELNRNRLSEAGKCVCVCVCVCVRCNTCVM